jgi:hypothetical protein
MFPYCRRASDHLNVPVERTTLLYKEGPELPRRLWGQQPPASPELFRLRPGAAPQILSPTEWGVSW